MHALRSVTVVTDDSTAAREARKYAWAQSHGLRECWPGEWWRLLKPEFEVREYATASHLPPDAPTSPYWGIGGQQRRRVQELKARGIQPQPWVRVVAGEDGRWLPALLPGDEHVSLWSREGAIVVYLSQPYSLNETEIAAMAESCEKYGLRVQIAAQPDWHNPGRVFGLLWTRRSESGLWALSDTGAEVLHE